VVLGDCGVEVVEAASRLLELALAAVLFVDAELIRAVTSTTIISDVVSCDHVDQQYDVRYSPRMKPNRTIVSGHVGHPICCSGPGLRGELHVALNLTDVGNKFGV
jgi:hypothetical protein